MGIFKWNMTVLLLFRTCSNGMDGPQVSPVGLKQRPVNWTALKHCLSKATFGELDRAQALFV